MCIVLLVCFAMLLGFDWLLIRVDWLVGVLSLVDCFWVILSFIVFVFGMLRLRSCLVDSLTRVWLVFIVVWMRCCIYLVLIHACVWICLLVRMVWFGLSAAVGYFSVLGRSDGCCIVCFV